MMIADSNTANISEPSMPAKEEKAAFSRRYELDLLKAVAIVAMIFCHAVIMLGAHRENYHADAAFFIGDTILGSYTAVAHAFMFSMGLTVVYSSKNRPSDLVRRGVCIYILAFILNFFRYGIYALADGLIEGAFPEETAYAFLCQDIFHFAGLALIFTGLLKACNLKEWQIFVVGLLLSAVGAPLAFAYQGYPALNYILGHFLVTTEDDSCFAFLNWYLFVGAGLLFGRFLRQTKNEDAFYRRVFAISAPVMVAYLVLSCVFGAFFLSKNNWYYAVSIPEALGLISIDLTLLSAFYFLLKKVPPSRFSVCIEMSRNLTPIYIAHWCILGFVDSIFCYLLGFGFPYWAIYLFGFALIVVSCFAARGWRAYRKKHRHLRENKKIIKKENH